MAATLIGTTPEGIVIYSGSEVERLAMTVAKIGTIFLQTGGNKYEANGAGGWNIISISGAALVSDGISGVVDTRELGALGIDVAVTFQDAGDTVTQTAHGLVNGTPISFDTIVTTTGITINTPYYVISTAANTFQVSLTAGGTAVALTTNGSGTLSLASLVRRVVFNSAKKFVRVTPRGAGSVRAMVSNLSQAAAQLILAGAASATINTGRKIITVGDYSDQRDFVQAQDSTILYVDVLGDTAGITGATVEGI
jgi:hypothetical protein